VKRFGGAADDDALAGVEGVDGLADGGGEEGGAGGGLAARVDEELAHAVVLADVGVAYPAGADVLAALEVEDEVVDDGVVDAGVEEVDVLGLEEEELEEHRHITDALHVGAVEVEEDREGLVDEDEVEVGGLDAV
jgi:hypothetical protein